MGGDGHRVAPVTKFGDGNTLNTLPFQNAVFYVRAHTPNRVCTTASLVFALRPYCRRLHWPPPPPRLHCHPPTAPPHPHHCFKSFPPQRFPPPPLPCFPIDPNHSCKEQNKIEIDDGGSRSKIRSQIQAEVLQQDCRHLFLPCPLNPMIPSQIGSNKRDDAKDGVMKSEAQISVWLQSWGKNHVL
ncbi:hypothetical protein DAI22_02g083100 [Oryza sativa Japonica Group]|nr:hypothetical protein DAI22_02g083100 [Oryza sativa Japonica Group]